MAVTSSVKNLTQCPLCLADIFDPTSLPCLHTFCMSCVQTMCDKGAGNNLRCPVCRKCCPISQSGADGFQRNFFVQSLLDAKSCIQTQPMCDVCTDVGRKWAASAKISKATVFCVNCSQKLCDRCSIPHKRMPGGSHQIKQLGDGFESDLVRFRVNNCRQHQDEMVKLYCFQCEVDMCWMCAAVQHRNHECKEISYVADDFKKRIQNLTSKVSTKVNEVQKQMTLLDAGEKKFISGSDAADKLIKKTGEDMKQLIDAQVSQLSNELAASKVEEVKKFEEKRMSYELAMIALESFNTYASELKEKGSSGDIVRASKELETRANELIKAEVVKYRGTSLTFTPVATKAGKLSIGRITKRNRSQQSQSPGFHFMTEVTSEEDEDIKKKERIILSPSAPVYVQREDDIIYWVQPLDDGGSPVTGYSIEYADATNRWSELSRVTASDSDFSLWNHEQSLEVGLRYRVRAFNEIGLGDPSEEV